MEQTKINFYYGLNIAFKCPITIHAQTSTGRYAAGIAFYFYGGSFEEMKRRIEPVIENNRLAQVSRIEQIA